MFSTGFLRYSPGVPSHSRSQPEHHHIQRSSLPYGVIVHRCCGGGRSCQITRHKTRPSVVVRLFDPHLRSRRNRHLGARRAICSHNVLILALFTAQRIYGFIPQLRWLRGTLVERRSVTLELSVSYARPAADG